MMQIYIKTWLFLCLSLFLLGCQKTVQLKPMVEADYLLMSDSKFDRFIVKNESAFHKYKKFYLKPLNLDELAINSDVKDKVKRSWTLDESTKAIFENYYTKAHEQYFKGKRDERFPELTAQPGADTLVVEFRLLDFRPYTMRNGDPFSGTVARTKVKSFGLITMDITMVDSITGEFVAYVHDGRNLTMESLRHLDINKSVQANAWKKTIMHWFKALDTDIERLHKET